MNLKVVELNKALVFDVLKAVSKLFIFLLKTDLIKLL